MGTRHKARTGEQFPSRSQNRQLMNVRCLCGKVYSPSRSKAKKLYRHIEQVAGSNHTVYFYECKEQGGWHWTKMNPLRWPADSITDPADEWERVHHGVPFPGTRRNTEEN